jgi:very-short-patch-repair endonuclease
MPIKNIIPGQTVTKEKLQRAKELRRDMTPAEKILWQELRANKLGVHFRSVKRPDRFHRGASLSGYYEWEGSLTIKALWKPVRSVMVLSEMGLWVVRFQGFRNDEVARDLSAVVGKMRELLQA